MPINAGPFPIPRRRQPLHRSTKRFAPAPSGLHTPDFEVSEEVFHDEEEGTHTVETMTTYVAGCSHVVGFVGPNELVGQCEKCGAWLCFRCSHVRCMRCLASICPSCANVYAESAVFCRRCRWIVRVLGSIAVTLRLGHKAMSKDLD